MNKKLLAALGVVSFAVVILSGGYFYLSHSQKTSGFTESLRKTLNIPKASPTPTVPTPIPTPRYIKPLPSGRQEYNISHGPDVKGPKPGKVVVNPLTPKKGEKQTTTLTIASDVPVTEAKIILHTDNKKRDYPLKLISGDASNGTWEASWTIDDSYDYNYYIQFYLKSANGLFENGMRLRQEW